MTDCRKIVLLLSEYYDGGLDAGERELVREHLDTCESCAALLRLFGDMSQALCDDIEPPAVLRENVMKSAMQTAPRAASPGRIIMLRRTASVAACIAVVLLALSIVRMGIGKSKSEADNESLSGATGMESAMMSEPEVAMYDEGGEQHFMIAEDFIVENGTLSDGEAPELAEDDAYNASNDLPYAGDASTPPSAPQGQAVPSDTPPPQMPPSVETADTTAVDGALPRIASGSGSDVVSGGDFSAYYAVFKLAGDVPPILDGYDRVDTGAWGLCIDIPLDVAKLLIDEGYDHVLYNTDAERALVILASN